MEWSLKKKRTYISRNIWYNLEGSWYRKQSGATERIKKLIDNTTEVIKFLKVHETWKNKSVFYSNNIHSKISLKSYIHCFHVEKGIYAHVKSSIIKDYKGRSKLQSIIIPNLAQNDTMALHVEGY